MIFIICFNDLSTYFHDKNITFFIVAVNFKYLLNVLWVGGLMIFAECFVFRVVHSLYAVGCMFIRSVWEKLTVSFDARHCKHFCLFILMVAAGLFAVRLMLTKYRHTNQHRMQLQMQFMIFWLHQFSSGFTISRKDFQNFNCHNFYRTCDSGFER